MVINGLVGICILYIRDTASDVSNVGYSIVYSSHKWTDKGRGVYLKERSGRERKVMVQLLALDQVFFIVLSLLLFRLSSRLR